MRKFGIFDDRSTELIFNDYVPGVVEPWLAVGRKAEEMAHGAGSVVSKMRRLPGIGYQIEPVTSDPGNSAYLVAANSGRLSVANGAQVATNFYEEDAFSQEDLTGVTYPAAVSTSGFPMIGAQIPAGTDYSANRLAADEAAFPGPAPEDDQATMDRVYRFDGLEPWDDIIFNVQVPSSVLSARGTFATLYFMGPPSVTVSGTMGGTDPAKDGTGQYALKLRADGRASLYELQEDDDWAARFSFLWNESPQGSPVSMVTIRIESRMWRDAFGNYYGDRITFVAETLLQDTNIVSAISNGIRELVGNKSRHTSKQNPVYNVYRREKKAILSGTDAVVRVDLARDCRAIFSCLRHVYRAEGSILDDWLPFPQPVTTKQDVILYAEGVIPSTTSVEFSVYDQDGTMLASSSGVTVYNTLSGQTAAQSFTPTSRMRGMRVKITFKASSDRLRTPTLTRYRAYRSPVYTEDNPLELVTVPQQEPFPALPRTTIESVSIMPQEADPGAQNATFTIWDLTGELAFLAERNMTPVLCRTRYDSNPAHWSHLFRGYVLTASGERMRYPLDHVYPSPMATRYTLQCVGEWARTYETLVPENKEWGSYEPTGEAFLVSDVIKYHALLSYPEDYVAIPDVPGVQLKSEDPGAYLQEVNTRTTDTMQAFASDYLGGYMLYDESAGTKGKLRLLLQKVAPYNNLAVFEIQHPTELAGDGVPRLPHWAKSYPTTTGSDGQEVQHTFIKAGTYNHWLEKAEGNVVTVTGSAVGEDANRAGAADGAVIYQHCLNVRSYNFLGLEEGDEGYPTGYYPDGQVVAEFYNRIVPIRVVDWKLATQEMVDWKCRRIYEKACFARYYLSFDAPLLLVTDKADDEQERPRPLRFYDAVQVRDQEGELKQFLVVSCTISYSKDHVQMARYVLVTQANIDTIGAVDYNRGRLRDFVKAFGRATGANWQYGHPISTQQKQGEANQALLFGLPAPMAPAIQDYDPNSATFGEFLGPTMESFDAIPTISV